MGEDGGSEILDDSADEQQQEQGDQDKQEQRSQKQKTAGETVGKRKADT